MDAVIAVKVNRTGVVLSWLFGQMAVCVLITDWVLDTVNTIKEETSFICSASPTRRHATHKKKRKKKGTYPKHQWKQFAHATNRQRQTHIHTHNKAQTRTCHRGSALCLCSLFSGTHKANEKPHLRKCWRTTRSHRPSPLSFLLQTILHITILPAESHTPLSSVSIPATSQLLTSAFLHRVWM